MHGYTIRGLPVPVPVPADHGAGTGRVVSPRVRVRVRTLKFLTRPREYAQWFLYSIQCRMV